MGKIKNIICIILIILIIGCMSYLTYYKNTNKAKTSEEVKEEIKIEDDETKIYDDENEKNDETSENVPSVETDTTVTTKDINNTTKEDFVKAAVSRFKEKEYNDFSNEDWIAYALYSLFSYTKEIELSKNEMASACSNDNYSQLTEEEWAICNFGVTNDEFNKIDKTLFKDMTAGSIYYENYDLDDMKNNLIKAYGTYGNIFNKSFRLKYEYCGYYNIVYDTNLNRIFAKPESGCTGRHERKIMEDKIIGNKYQITYIEYYDGDDNGTYVVSDENKNKLYSVDSVTDLKIEENIDLFKKHTIEFEKVNDMYKYSGEIG